MSIPSGIPKSRGKSSRRWEAMRKRHRAQSAALNLPCHICGEPIDYTLHYPHPRSYSTDHRVAVSVDAALAEDPGNLQPSHLVCNQRKGNRPTTGSRQPRTSPGLYEAGVYPSRSWDNPACCREHDTTPGATPGCRCAEYAQQARHG